MKIFNYFLFIGIATLHASTAFGQVSNNCGWTQTEETRLNNLATANQTTSEIDQECVEKENYFDALSNYEKIQSLPPGQLAIFSGGAINKIQSARNIWALAPLHDEKFEKNQMLTWGQILNAYKKNMDLYFAALDKKNDVQVNFPQKFSILASSLNQDLLDAEKAWIVYGFKISVEAKANHVMAASH